MSVIIARDEVREPFYVIVPVMNLKNGTARGTKS